MELTKELFDKIKDELMLDDQYIEVSKKLGEPHTQEEYTAFLSEYMNTDYKERNKIKRDRYVSDMWKQKISHKEAERQANAKYPHECFETLLKNKFDLIRDFSYINPETHMREVRFFTSEEYDSHPQKVIEAALKEGGGRIAVFHEIDRHKRLWAQLIGKTKALYTVEPNISPESNINPPGYYLLLPVWKEEPFMESFAMEDQSKCHLPKSWLETKPKGCCIVRDSLDWSEFETIEYALQAAKALVKEN